MALISPADQQKLRESFGAMTGPVRLLFFTQTLGCETCPQTRQILDELPVLSDKIAIEEINIVLDSEKAKQYGIDRVPAIAIVGQDGSGAERDSKIRFLGTPAGYEFISLDLHQHAQHPAAYAVEATEFPDLVRRYQVTGVPKTVVNEQVEILGALPEDAFVEQALGQFTIRN